MEAPLTNGTHASAAPLQFSVPMPHAPQTRIYLHLTRHKHCTLLFLTSGSGSPEGVSPGMGSFVYAVPDRTGQNQSPNCTVLYGSSVSAAQGDFATRLAKLLARKTGKPAYVGNSVAFGEAAGGGNVEEEMQGFRKVVMSLPV